MTFLRYASKVSNLVTTPPPTTKISLATALTNVWSWETRITPPGKFFTASARASTLSRSRLLVGSSMIRTWGFRNETAAIATRERWPPDRHLAVVVCSSEVTPVCASCFLSSCSWL
mmetsp:Transcript_20270/g.31684  ORF Transcript_20270/g.31684 Transcript_20270/m.31684 type:complete len:116 (-) Transcript_20270:1262-1609(-)